MENETALLIVLAIIGSLLIGKGITGFAVISQTCCIGENCAPEDMCEFARQESQNPFAVNSLSVISGMALVFLSLIAIHKHLHEKK